MAGLVIVRGLPGSGVSKQARRSREELDFDFIYEDNMFFEDVKAGTELNYFVNTAIASHECRVHTFSALMRGYDVVVGNYFIKYKEIMPYVLMSLVLLDKFPTVIETQGKDAKDSVVCAGRSRMGFTPRQIGKMIKDWESCNDDGVPDDIDKISDERLGTYLDQIGRASKIKWDALNGAKRLHLMQRICS